MPAQATPRGPAVSSCGPLERAPASPVPWPAARQPTAVCAHPQLGPRPSGPSHAREERSRGHPRPPGSAYLYPLVRGPKVQNRTMLDKPREEAQRRSSPEPRRGAGGQRGRPALRGLPDSLPGAGAGRGASGQAGGMHRPGLFEASPRACRALGRGRRGPALTELLQLRGHGLGSKGEGCGRSALRRRRSWGRAAEMELRAGQDAALPHPSRTVRRPSTCWGGSGGASPPGRGAGGGHGKLWKFSHVSPASFLRGCVWPAPGAPLQASLRPGLPRL